VELVLQWEDRFGVAPRITDAISEFDAAMLVGMSEEEYCADGKLRTAVTRGKDFTFDGVRYQITANRPSGKKGSAVSWVRLKKETKRQFEWDKLVWLLYDRHYVLQEAWEFDVDDYRSRFATTTRLSPDHMRQGRCVYPAVQGTGSRAISP
jgi:hypothetical protein